MRMHHSRHLAIFMLAWWHGICAWHGSLIHYTPVNIVSVYCHITYTCTHAHHITCRISRMMSLYIHQCQKSTYSPLSTITHLQPPTLHPHSPLLYTFIDSFNLHTIANMSYYIIQMCTCHINAYSIPQLSFYVSLSHSLPPCRHLKSDIKHQHSISPSIYAQLRHNEYQHTWVSPTSTQIWAFLYIAYLWKSMDVVVLPNISSYY